MRYEIGMTGTGGQGIVLLGSILAEAAATLDGLYIAQTQSYDPAVRGGKAEASLVISDEEVDWPGAYKLDVLLALSQEGFDRNIAYLKEDGLLIIDPDLVQPGGTVIDTGGDSDLDNENKWQTLEIPFSKLAKSKFKDDRVINMLALGALARLSSYFPSEAVLASVSSKFKGKVLDLNLAALSEGNAQGQISDHSKE